MHTSAENENWKWNKHCKDVVAEEPAEAHRSWQDQSQIEVEVNKGRSFDSCSPMVTVLEWTFRWFRVFPASACLFLLPLVKSVSAPTLKIASAKMQSYLYSSHTLSAGLNACMRVCMCVCVFKPFLFLFLSLSMMTNHTGKEAGKAIFLCEGSLWHARAYTHTFLQVRFLRFGASHSCICLQEQGIKKLQLCWEGLLASCHPCTHTDSDRKTWKLWLHQTRRQNLCVT